MSAIRQRRVKIERTGGDLPLPGEPRGEGLRTVVAQENCIGSEHRGLTSRSGGVAVLDAADREMTLFDLSVFGTSSRNTRTRPNSDRPL